MADNTNPSPDNGQGGNNTPPAWTTGLDAAFVGHAQNKGWDKLAPDAAARAAVQAHREIETMVGVPGDRLLKLPAANADPKEWEPVYQRLGAPKEVKEYDFSSVKDKAGNPLDDDFAKVIAQSAFSQHLSKGAAIQLAKDIVAWKDGLEAQDNTVDQAAIAQEKAKLRESWGKFFDARMLIAKQVAQKFGFDEATIGALENQVGYFNVMRALSEIGSAIGEDTFINPGKSNNGALTKEQAAARIEELKRDETWVGAPNIAGSYLGGDGAKNREFQALLKIASGEA